MTKVGTLKYTREATFYKKEKERKRKKHRYNCSNITITFGYWHFDRVLKLMLNILPSFYIKTVENLHKDHEHFHCNFLSLEE